MVVRAHMPPLLQDSFIQFLLLLQLSQTLLAALQTATALQLSVSCPVALTSTQPRHGDNLANTRLVLNRTCVTVGDGSVRPASQVPHFK